MRKVIEFLDGFVTLFFFVFLAAFAVIFPVMSVWELSKWLLK